MQVLSSMVYMLFFFFQAEDGIRDYKGTGVQTCALPILPPGPCSRAPVPSAGRAPTAAVERAGRRAPGVDERAGPGSRAPFDAGGASRGAGRADDCAVAAGD